MSYPYEGEVEYETTGDLNDAIHYERLDADMEMAALEAEGNAYARRVRRVAKLVAAGDLNQAVQVCPHGHVGMLSGSCTDRDPRHGQEGARCYECGGHVTDVHGEVLNTR